MDGRLVEPVDFVTLIDPGLTGLPAAQVARAAGRGHVLVVGIEVDERRAIARDLGFQH